MKLLSSLVAAVFFCGAGFASAAEVNPVMHSFGAIGAQSVFATHMAIAELADAYGSKMYDKDKAIQLATMYGKLTESAKESLTDLIESGKLDKADTDSVREMVIINDHLSNMAKGIVTYINSPTKRNEAAYTKSLGKSWKAITKFLGIEE